MAPSRKPEAPKPKPKAKASLATRLKQRIRRKGPISVADYMSASVSDSGLGYYASREPFGKAGDFITAPEISQIFGELIGLWCLAVWEGMGEPETITVAELGPGRGTLIGDALRAWAIVPEFLQRVSIALVEASPRLREAQKKSLAEAPVTIGWHDDLSTLPEGPLILIANEFLDALPIRQFVRRDGHWHERSVALDDDAKFVFAAGDLAEEDDAPLSALVPDAEDDSVLETRPAADALIAALGKRAKLAPLAALFIDYGHEQSGTGDTLQAVSEHHYTDALATPGKADLSAHVDFAALKRAAAANDLVAYGPMSQGAFLLKLGLGVRRDRLLEIASPTQREAIASGTVRLIDPAQMGLLYKAMAITGAGLPPPPPFSQEV